MIERTAEFSHSHVLPAPWPPGEGIFSKVLKYLERRERRLRDARRLSVLPDYLLDDMGLKRSDLPSAERFW
ncbi:DUF1127 domain-containing protein [Roseibium aggregatum]|uniref:DUF1127 domain-containing protein n=1 Tax=Roseibium aggregatum TaxID=187304 RepID=A0A939J358_9HYPH|nr:DUF1127 domain-containing protein [Roseibium aggregatum]MBN9669314.1 DUF1127 domain-containing protein [Roseibium aggregatum]